MTNFPDHPEITRALRTGYPRDATWPTCPLCGEVCETIYRDTTGRVAGCDTCLTPFDAWNEKEACFPEKYYGEE